MDGRNGGADQLGDGGRSVPSVNQSRCEGFLCHRISYAIIAMRLQAPIAYFCDNRLCGPVATIAKDGVQKKAILEMMVRRNWKQVHLAEALGISQDKVNKSLKGTRQWQGDEALKLAALMGDHDDSTKVPDVPPGGKVGRYVDIAVLPSYAGAGGGGTGEGEQQTAKVSRALIEDELHGSPGDFELIDVRGDSMTGLFENGDQLLIDKRDRDPIQPGPFVLWDEDGYVVKLVERVPGKRGWYRVFSKNPTYSEYEIEETETTIRGRPVWFARRL